jgi:CRP-like cAMP-binding protein
MNNIKNSLAEFLAQLYPIEHELLEAYLDLWSEQTVPKKQLMTMEGETQRYMYFVLEGLQKSYYLKEGKQHVIAFTYPPSFSGIPESFLTQTPSKYFLESITDSHFLRIPYEQHTQFMEEHRAIESLFRKATELFMIGMIDRYYELMAFSIEERFRAFMSRSPHLLHQVPHKDLASYLRIDPTNFSKLLSSVRL